MTIDATVRLQNCHVADDLAQLDIRAVLNANSDANLLIGPDDRIIFSCETAQSQFASPDPMDDLRWISIFPEGPRVKLIAMTAQARGGAPAQAELDMGGTALQQVSLTPLQGDILLCTIRPVNPVLSESLRVQEADHRIKNSLSSIASLLRMQARVQPDAAAQAALRDASRRVHSLSAIHHHVRAPMDQESVAAHVPARAFLGQLSRDLATELAGERVTLLYAIDPIDLTARQASALGLITAEAITNALSHGFGENPEGGLIYLTLSRVSEDRLRLRISDTGKGWPEDFDWCAHQQMGGRIMDLYAGSLGGTLTCEGVSGGGARLEVVFPT